MNKTISLDVPPEPPKTSVVLDRAGVAWQRHDEGWLQVGRFLLGGGPSWPSLLISSGPLRVIHNPEDE